MKKLLVNTKELANSLPTHPRPENENFACNGYTRRHLKGEKTSLANANSWHGRIDQVGALHGVARVPGVPGAPHGVSFAPMHPCLTTLRSSHTKTLLADHSVCGQRRQRDLQEALHGSAWRPDTAGPSLQSSARSCKPFSSSHEPNQKSR